MGYLVQKTRPSSLTINGVDYTSSLLRFEVSDDSANRNGLIATSGTIELGQKPGGYKVSDYDRNAFKRGHVVILDLVDSQGTVFRHPRGYLYVVGTAYNVEAETMSIEVGCQIALAYLNDDTTNIYPLVPLPLDEAQRSIQSCSASFASAGQYLFQNNQGALVSGKFFDGDSNSAIKPGEWVSVLGTTAMSVAPLQGAEAIPEKIELAYSIPTALNEDGLGKVDTVREVSNYFLTYPAATWERQEMAQCFLVDPNTGERTEIYCIERDGGVDAPPVPPAGPSGCGNTPPPPSSASNPTTSVGIPLPVACNYGYETVAAPVFVSATKITESRTEYSAPGAQVSRTYSQTIGPALELNQQYYSDKYAYCTQLYGYACNPGGSCPFEGLENTLQGYVETTNFYGEANELIETVQDTYATTLSAARPFDWRSGSKNGVPQDFNPNLSTSEMYRASSVITQYSKNGNANIQFTTTYTSIASRGGGISEGVSLDALDGIKTSRKRVSTTNTVLDIRPDTVNSVTTEVEEQKVTIILERQSTKTPVEAGLYVVEETIPIPLLSINPEEIEGIVADYSRYLKNFVMGDVYGLQIAEALRPEIVTGWQPGMSFRYADNANSQILALRMDACVWGVDQNEALVATSGIWTGYSDGTLVIGDNLQGNSRPDMTPDEDGTVIPPVDPSPPPTIDNDVVGQSLYFNVDVDMNLATHVVAYGNNGVVPIFPTDLTSKTEVTLTVFSSGIVVEAGGLLGTTGTGSIPLDYNGSLVVANAVVVTPELMITPTPPDPPSEP